MRDLRTETVLTRLRAIFTLLRDDPRTDEELLNRFAEEQDEDAFSAVVGRHAPLVWRTCCRVLGEGPDAEDAFQVTFLTLARWAKKPRRGELAGWLFQVARRAAQDVRAAAERRRRLERQQIVETASGRWQDPAQAETYRLLDEELAELPERLRVPLVLRYLEGKTLEEVARIVGCSRQAVSKRLARGEGILRERLSYRGLTVGAGAVAGLLTGTAAGEAAVRSRLVVETTRLAVASCSGTLNNQTAQAALALLPGKAGWVLKSWLVVLLGVGVLFAGAVGWQVMSSAPTIPSSPTGGADSQPKEAIAEPRLDLHGDPLPPGALARLGTVRWRHATNVRSLAFTPDGKGLIAAGQGEPARLWDVATGRMLRQFGDNRDNPVCAVALSPDGRTLAGRVAAGGLCLWDVATGTLLRRPKAGQVASSHVLLAFSPDGKTVASADGTQRLCVWEVATGKELWSANPLHVFSLTYSADGKALIWAGYRGELHLWDAAAGKELRRWDDDKKHLSAALAASADGHLFTAHDALPGETGGLAHLWDVATDKEVWQRTSGKGSITAAAFSPNSEVLATGRWDGSIHLWDAATGKELRRCAGSDSAIQCLAFAPDGKTLASGGGGGIGGCQNQVVRLWDVQSGREVRRPLVGHEAAVCSAAFTPDGQDIVSSSWEGSLRVWDAAAGKQRRQILPADDKQFVGGWIASIASAVSPDGKSIVAANWERSNATSRIKVRRWDRQTGQELASWSRPLGDDAPRSLVFSPDGKTVACMSIRVIRDDRVYLWDAATGKEISKIAGGYPAFSSDGKLLATASLGPYGVKPGSFTLWEAATAKEVCSVPVPEGYVYRLLFSPDGKMLVTASRSALDQPGAIHLWPLLRDETRKSGVRVGPPRRLDGGFPPCWFGENRTFLCRPGRRLLDGGFPPSWFGGWSFSPDSRTGCGKSFGSAYVERKAQLRGWAPCRFAYLCRSSLCLPNPPYQRTPLGNNCVAGSSNCVRRWPPPSTRRPPVRSSMPARRKSGMCLPTSDGPPTRPPSNSAATPPKRLFPPPLHPQTGKPLQNKGPDERTILTVNGRISLCRRRYAAAGVGSSYPLDAWLDRVEDTISLGLRELACRLNLASRNFDKAAENLGRAAQVFLSGAFLRQVVESEGQAVVAAAGAGQLPIDGQARDCPALDKGGQKTERSRIYLGSDGVRVPHVTAQEKRTRRDRIKAKRRRCGKKRRALPKARPGADGPFKEFKIVTLYDDAAEHRLVSVTRGDCAQAGRLMRRDAGRVGLDKADDKVGVVDGSEWIKNQIQRQSLPLDDLGLDFYPLSENVHKARRAVYGEEDPKDDKASGHV